MPLPDFGALMIQFEQLDNQREQLLLQRQEQTARNIAQAVSTLVSTPMEGRAGYLQTISQELGLDTRFLSALAESAPTPTAILLNQGLQRAINAGAVDDTDLTAYALGADPFKYRVNTEIGKYLDGGPVPSFIQMLPKEQRAIALTDLISKMGGMPNTYELENYQNVNAVRLGQQADANAELSNTGQNQRQASSLRVQQSEGAASRGVQMAGIRSNEALTREGNQLRNLQGLASEEGANYRAELGLFGTMNRPGGRGGNGGRGGTGAGAQGGGLTAMERLVQAEKEFQEAQKLDSDTKKITQGIFGSGAGNNVNTIQAAMRRTDATAATAYERVQQAQRDVLSEQADEARRRFNQNPGVVTPAPFATVQPAQFGQLLQQQGRP